MARAKRESFAPDLVALARVARALSHPGRLHILGVLAARRGCVCGDVVVASPLAQSTVSQHLKELKAAGLVRGEVEGPRTCYCLDEAALAAAGRDFARLFTGLLAGGQPQED
ncbi:helix-turn-helix transcriptional regulator [bacterium]|nr:helix-turn-helix transcriptional regulator [bacterium]